jgi:hypothetical protein
MNSAELLRRAAAAMCGPGAYAAGSDNLAVLAWMRPYCASGALERASCRLRSGSAFCARGDPNILAEAKARVCRVVGFPHIDLWEAAVRPDWRDVRRAFREAA